MGVGVPGVHWKYKILASALERVPKPHLSQFGRAEFGAEAGFCQEMETVTLRNAGRADPGRKWETLKLGCAEPLCH